MSAKPPGSLYPAASLDEGGAVTRETITRGDGGSFVADGFRVGDAVRFAAPWRRRVLAWLRRFGRWLLRRRPVDLGTYRVVAVEPTVLAVDTERKGGA